MKQQEIENLMQEAVQATTDERRREEIFELFAESVQINQPDDDCSSIRAGLLYLLEQAWQMLLDEPSKILYLVTTFVLICGDRNEQEFGTVNWAFVPPENTTHLFTIQ